MARSSKQASDHEPSGNPDHVAYGKDYHWVCTCGQRSVFLTDEDTAHYQAEEHERYCDGTATVGVSR